MSRKVMIALAVASICVSFAVARPQGLGLGLMGGASIRPRSGRGEPIGERPCTASRLKARETARAAPAVGDATLWWTRLKRQRLG